MVLPRFVDAALAGKPPTVHDDGLQQRCFAHVADVVRAVLSLMDTPQAFGQVINIGSDEPITILDLARRVVDKVDPKLEIRFQSYAEAYSEDFEDCRCRVPELDRLRELIGFSPKYDLDDAIDEIIADKSKPDNRRSTSEEKS